MNDKFSSLFESCTHHLISKGFNRSYQSIDARDVVYHDHGFVAYSGSKNPIYTQTNFESCDMVLDGVNRVYTPTPLKLPLSEWKETKRKEYVLDLSKPIHMKSKTKHREINAPKHWIQDNQIEFKICTSDDSLSIEKLWVKWSMDKFYQGVLISNFPTQRCIRCFEDGYDDKDYIIYGLFKQDVCYGARVLSLSLKSNTAFCLSFMSDRSFPHAARSLRDMSHDHLSSLGIRFINYGETLGSGLTHFKERLSPELLISYQYDRLTRVESPKIKITSNKRHSSELQCPSKIILDITFQINQN